MKYKLPFLKIFRAFLAIIACFSLLQLPEEIIDIDNWLGNWREALFSERAKSQSQDITIIEINEKSLANYGHISPIPRDYLAQVIKKLDNQQPKSIIIDIIFDRHTQKSQDEELIQTIKNTKTKIYIACIDASSQDNENQTSFQTDFVKRSSAKCVYPNFSSSINKMIVNQIPKANNIQINCSLPSSVMGNECENYSKNAMRIDWLLPPNSGESLFATFDANMIDGLAASPFNPFTARHIFIGGNFNNIDKHRTPIDLFKKDKNENNGVQIHAIAAQQILDGRKIIEINEIGISILIIIFAIFGTYCADNSYILRNPEAFLFINLCLGMMLDLIFYKSIKFIFPYEYIIFAIDIGFFIAIWFDNVKNRVLNINQIDKA